MHARIAAAATVLKRSSPFISDHASVSDISLLI